MMASRLVTIMACPHRLSGHVPGLFSSGGMTRYWLAGWVLQVQREVHGLRLLYELRNGR